MRSAAHRTGLEHSRPRWQQSPGGDVISGYLLAERLEAWEAEHQGWSVEYRSDFGYWEALRRRDHQLVAVCRATVEEVFARVDEVLAAETAPG
jgi:hypothetical protein